MLYTVYMSGSQYLLCSFNACREPSTTPVRGDWMAEIWVMHRSGGMTQLPDWPKKTADKYFSEADTMISPFDTSVIVGMFEKSGEACTIRESRRRIR